MTGDWKRMVPRLLERVSNQRRRARPRLSWLENLRLAEKALLLRYISVPFRQRMVPAGGDILLNTIELGEASADTPTIVLTHGYGSGIGFWASTLESLTQVRTARGKSLHVVAVDWPGMGASSRVPFTKRCASNDESTMEAERYFCEPLEAWRASMGISKPFILLGHSLGGFLSSAYTIRYPERVSSLILVSPVGLQSAPSDSSSLPSTPPIPLTIGQRIFVSGWSNNITPQRLIRLSGPYGARLTDRIVQARFHDLSEHDQRLLSDYLYRISSAPPGGEYSLNGLLIPIMTGTERGVFARAPIGERLMNDLNASTPITIMFGDRDWMFNRRIESLPLIESSRARLVRIDDAGHHIYLDNAPQFIDLIRTTIDQLR